MKKIKILGLGILTSGAILLSSCTSNSLKDLVHGGDNQNNVTTNSEAFLMQATSSLKLLSNIDLGSARLSRSLNDTEINEIKEILPQLDLMLNNGTSFESSLTSKENVIEGVTYEYEEVVTFKDSNLIDVTYTLIYNANTKEFKDDDEKVTVTTIEGVAKVDDVTYLPFVSITKTENEWDESETERTFKVNLNENSYVIVEESHEVEDDETENEFEYTLINNGRKELEYSIEIEKEGFKDSIEYEVNNKEYELTRVGDEYYVKVKEGRNFVDYAKFKKIINEDGSVIFELVN